MTVVKFDIEGAEHRVLTDIVLDGTICRIDVLAIVFHLQLCREDQHVLSSRPAGLRRLLAVSKCKTRVLAPDYMGVWTG
jgi:hypothetical protein